MLPWTFAFGAHTMPSIYDVKPKFQNLLRPSMRMLAAAGVSPNMVTLAAVAGSAAAGWCGAKHSLWALPLWLFLRMALNAIDGMMARELDRKSRIGAILNEAGDVVSDVILYGPLALLTDPWPVNVFVFGSVLTEFCGVLMQALDGVRRYEGPMGKSDRAFAVGFLALVTALWPGLREHWPPVFWILAGMTLMTCVQRCRVLKP
jgi:phosphatidylglycerophosphate synthase